MKRYGITAPAAVAAVINALKTARQETPTQHMAVHSLRGGETGCTPVTPLHYL